MARRGSKSDMSSIRKTKNGDYEVLIHLTIMARRGSKSDMSSIRKTKNGDYEILFNKSILQ